MFYMIFFRELPSKCTVEAARNCVDFVLPKRIEHPIESNLTKTFIEISNTIIQSM